MRRFLDELSVRVKPQLPGLSPEERAALSDAVGKLNSHERRVLELRYGPWGLTRSISATSPSVCGFSLVSSE